MSWSLRYLSLPAVLAALLWAPPGCGGSGELRDASFVGGSFARVAVSYVHQHEDPPDNLQLEAEGMFVRYRNAEADGVWAMLGLSPPASEVNRGECRVFDRQARYAEAFTLEGPDVEVALLDAGDLQLRGPAGAALLAPRRYPDLVPFLSGVYYGQNDPLDESDARLQGDLLVVGLGGPEVGPFAATVALPIELPLSQVTPAAGGLDVRWTGAREREGVRIEVRPTDGDHARTLVCSAADDGSFFIPPDGLGELETRAVSVSTSRTRRQQFGASGMSGELVVSLRDTSDVTLPVATRGRPVPGTPR